MNHHSWYHEIPNRDEIANDLIKPLHLYAMRMSPKPTLIKDNLYRQECYSEYLIRYKKDGSGITLMSRPAIQQFKLIDENSSDAPEWCFKQKFAWYCSWFFDIDRPVRIKNVDDEDYPFYIPQDIIVNFGQIYPKEKYDLHPVWIPFFIKKESKFIKKEYGKIEKHTPAYDMELL